MLFAPCSPLRGSLNAATVTDPLPVAGRAILPFCAGFLGKNVSAIAFLTASAAVFNAGTNQFALCFSPGRWAACIVTEEFL
ncbi:hypothetical protein KR94_05825 [Pantoea ananatis]|nr:hypothetical protein KR94_05825 [Pantoea ananatis]